MARQTFASTGQTYDSIGSTFGHRIGRVWIDNFERDNLAYTSLYDERGEIRTSARYTGQRGYFSPKRFTTEVWSDPTSDGSPIDSSRQAWPAPGDEFCFVTRLLEIESAWQTWYLWGGQGRYPRYQAEFIRDGTFRIQTRADDGERTTIASTEGGPVDWESHVGTWLALVIRWEHEDEGDDDNGIRAFVVEADAFPFQAFSFEDYDDGEFDFDPIVEIETPYAGSPDGSDIVPQERGKIGFRGSTNVSFEVDDIELISGSEPAPSEPSDPGGLPQIGSTITTPGDNAIQNGVSQPSGAQIEAHDHLTGFRLQISEDTMDYTHAYIQQPSGGSIITEKEISDLDAGETFDIEASLQAGEQYVLIMDADGSNYQRGRYEASDQYPYTSDDFDIVSGIFSDGGAQSFGVRYCFDEFTALK
jgi:hypothetical protein